MDIYCLIYCGRVKSEEIYENDNEDDYEQNRSKHNKKFVYDRCEVDSDLAAVA